MEQHYLRKSENLRKRNYRYKKHTKVVMSKKLHKEFYLAIKNVAAEKQWDLLKYMQKWLK